MPNSSESELKYNEALKKKIAKLKKKRNAVMRVWQLLVASLRSVSR